jgi:hypothetical protein
MYGIDDNRYAKKRLISITDKWGAVYLIRIKEAVTFAQILARWKTFLIDVNDLRMD